MKAYNTLKIAVIPLAILIFLSVMLVFVEGGSAGRVGRVHHSTTVVRTGPAATGSVHRHHHQSHKHRYEARKDFREDVQRDRRRWRIGTSLTAAAFRNLGCRSEIIVIGNVTYYRCGGGWYRRAYTAGTVTYIVVEVPAGY